MYEVTKILLVWYAEHGTTFHPATAHVVTMNNNHLYDNMTLWGQDEYVLLQTLFKEIQWIKWAFLNHYNYLWALNKNSHIKLCVLEFKISAYLLCLQKKKKVWGHRQICHRPRDLRMELQSCSVHPNSVAFDSTSLTTTRAPRQPLAFF